MFVATTRGLRVTVTPHYLPDQSDSAKSQITDGLVRNQEVKGPGVVCKTPRLRPGEMFEYTSGTSLSTPSGFMGGTYQMVSEAGENFDIEIPTFSLDTPSAGRKLN